jgi:hypothetical protein
MKRVLKHWKTSVAGVLVGGLTIMLYTGKIGVTEWAEGLGVVATIIGLLAKDWDKSTES